MLIDWFTVGAQVVNFLILVWLLKRFLYKPILNAIDGREKRIADELAGADAKKAQAQKESGDFQAKIKAFDDQRDALMSKAEGDAKAVHDLLVGDARKEADGLRSSQENAMRNELAQLGGEITRLVTSEVFEIARKALADLATVSLEERIGEVFTRRLREMDAKSKGAMAYALNKSSEAGVVRSSFDLGAAQKAAIQNALNEEFSAEVRIRFETAPDGICGIELLANGQKLAWSISEYLFSLQKGVSALVEARSGQAGIAANPVAVDLPTRLAPAA
jgi:F-type H+-transporting ATPase subunit b